MPKVVENDIIEEFTIDYSKRSLVADVFERIGLLFQVLVTFSSPEASASKTGWQWLALKGEKEKTVKAKLRGKRTRQKGRLYRRAEYIKSLCNPEEKISVPFSEEFYAVIYSWRNELESTTRAVVNFPSRKECFVQGSQEAVIMVKTAIEDRLSNITLPSSHQDIDPSLREFALKLGYSKQVIDQAVRKLGKDVSQNTLLSELLKTTASLPYQISASVPQPVASAPAVHFPRREVRDVIARGASNLQPALLRAGYENPSEMYMERGATHLGIPLRQDINGQPHMLRTDYENPVDSLLPTASDISERGTTRGTKRVYERNADIVARGSSTPMRPLVPAHTSYVQPFHSAQYAAGVSDRVLPDRQDEQFVYQQIQDVKDNLGESSSDLRPVVIDGSNVAMSHGRQEYFSCKGIQLCVDWFRKKGHKEITVFVPLWRKEVSRPDRRITDQDILYSLERDRVLVFTPSRKVNGRRIVCYDDRFIIKLAAETDGIVVSNDNFRDLAKESQKWKDTIDQRLLMYSFVGDLFMVPDDPLGKHGPSLDEFLRKGSATHPRICPYLKKCTYGLKCRFYHPERAQERTESNRKLQELRSIFSESVPDAVMIRVLNDSPGADVSVIANQLCDMGYGLGKH